MWTYKCIYLFVTILTSHYIASYGQEDDAQKAHVVDQKTPLIELDEDNWQSMLKGEWMVEFFAPWCPACRNLASTWEAFAFTASKLKVNVAKIDVTTSPSLSGRFFVTALPTIYHVKNGEFRQYRGSREADALLMFVKENQWRKIDPVSSWKKPDTFHMSILSYFFKLSHSLKDFNAYLQESYGLPAWASYGLFAVGTIVVGAALGLALVCLVDLLYPPKKTQRQIFSETEEAPYNAVAEIANDEIADDAEPQQDEVEDNDRQEKDDESEDNENANKSEPENEGDPIDEQSDKASESTSKTDSDDQKSDEMEAAVTNNPEDPKEKTSPGGVRKRKPRKD